MKKIKYFIVLFCMVLGINAQAQKEINYEIQSGPYQGTIESLEDGSYECPEWFRDAKFGIWAHWGPQSIPGQGDWYARHMYISDPVKFEQFFLDRPDDWNDRHWNTNIGDWEKSASRIKSKYHCEHFGHQSEYGYKDMCNDWRAEKFDAEKLIGIYKKAGAKYVALIGHHHDNFDLWNSKYFEWNSVRVGPHKDFVRMFGDAAKDAGLYFGVTLHPARTDWFSGSRIMSDTEGSLKGVLYDGSQTIEDGKGKWWEGMDPQKLYGKPGSEYCDWTDEECYEYFLRAKDLIDNYKLDLLYFDEGRLPRREAGANIAAHFYNTNIKQNGSNQAVLNIKTHKSYAVADTERGVGGKKKKEPWQTDTCIGNWFYTEPGGRKFKSADFVIKILVDIVSKNGNLLLNIPMPGSGDLEERGLKVLEDVGEWMEANGEGIYETRPWVTFGEAKELKEIKSGHHNESNLSYRDDEYRFTQKGDVIYAFAMGTPNSNPLITALSRKSDFVDGDVTKVTLLGYGELTFKQGKKALEIILPGNTNQEYVYCFKVEGLKTNIKADREDIHISE